MNKNTILAFFLIILSITLFTSKFYYEKILGIKHPSTISKEAAQTHQSAEKIVPVEEKKTELSQPSIKSIGALEEQNSIDNIPLSESLAYDTVWIETENLLLGISELGARIIYVKTRNFRIDPIDQKQEPEKNPYIDLVEDEGIGGANLSINDKSYDNQIFKLSESKKKFSVVGNDTLKLAFSILDNTGKPVLEKIFNLPGQGYMASLEIKSDDLDGKKVSLGWLSGIKESEKTGRRSSSGYDIRKVHLYDGKSVYQIVDKKEAKSIEPGFYQWVSLTSKYFVFSIISDTPRDQEVLVESYIIPNEENDDAAKKEKQINYRFSTQRIVTGQSDRYSLYMGPSQLDELKKHHIKLEKVLFGGWKWFLRADLWFPIICEFVLWLLIQLNKIVHDYGVVIIILTILSRVVTYPLTHSSMKSMSRMRDLQPKIQEIRNKYKNDAKKMNQKMMELYKKEGVNPLNPGCLPMFLQMPVFIALFIVLQKSIELRGSGTWLVPWVHDLSKPEVLPIPFINPLPFEIPMYGSNIALLPILMAILTYFQNKATIKDPNQKMMIYFMPIFMLLLFNNFPAGLVLYWTFSSALAIVQQYWTDSKKKNASTVTVQDNSVKAKKR
jgi:YidC/Oxa1 family membrane protein insertase